MAQGYKDVKETSVYVAFKVKGEENAFYPGLDDDALDAALQRGALHESPRRTMSKSRPAAAAISWPRRSCPRCFEEGTKFVERKKGSEWEGLAYEPLFPWAKVDKKAWYVTCDGYVTLTDGTGVVHIAPAFGEDDANVGRKYNLPFVQIGGRARTLHRRVRRA